jgi:hypothetical protein
MKNFSYIGHLFFGTLRKNLVGAEVGSLLRDHVVMGLIVAEHSIPYFKGLLQEMFTFFWLELIYLGQNRNRFWFSVLKNSCDVFKGTVA